MVYRKALVSDLDGCREFINMVFSMAHMPHDFRAMLPKVYGDGVRAEEMHSIAAAEDGGIRGLVAVMPGEMNVMGECLCTGYVGSVSVHPYHRGEGHMKVLMNMVIDEAKQSGCDLMMLSGQRQRYEYFGFSKGGVQMNYAITKTNLRHALKEIDVSGLAFVPMRSAEKEMVDAAHALSQAQPVYSLRSRDDFETICESWRNTAHVVLRGGEFLGYLIASGDFREIAEILLADENLYSAVIKGWMEHKKLESVRMSAAEYNKPLNSALAAFAETYEADHAGMLKVINFPRVVAAMMNMSARCRRLQDGSYSLVIDGQPLSILVENGCVSVTEEALAEAKHMTAMEAQCALFSQMVGHRDLQAPAGWFPLPLHMLSADTF